MNETQLNLEEIAAFLRAHSTLALATVDAQGCPCVAPLFYLVDTELNLCWLSSKKSEHSVNLQRNPDAAATVYGETADWKQIRGVQMRGRAEAVTDAARRKELIAAYCERFELGTLFRLVIGRSTLYMLKPSRFRLVDNTKGFGYRVEIELDGR